MTTTYTPGPWTVNGREIVGPDDSGVIVARLPDWGILADGPDPAPANAALIAAAPDAPYGRRYRRRARPGDHRRTRDNLTLQPARPGGRAQYSKGKHATY